jgi:hypothetical protein
MRKYDVEPTAKAIDEIALSLEDSAKSIKRIAASMRDRGDLTLAADAAHCAKSCLNSLRLDLLVTRPLRETMKNE